MNEGDLRRIISGMEGSLEQLSMLGQGAIDEPIQVESGGGLVKVEIGTEGEVEKISIDPLLLDKENSTHLEQLLIAAVNDGQTKFASALRDKTISNLFEQGPDGNGLPEHMRAILKNLNL